MSVGEDSGVSLTEDVEDDDDSLSNEDSVILFVDGSRRSTNATIRGKPKDPLEADRFKAVISFV